MRKIGKELEEKITIAHKLEKKIDEYKEEIS